MAGAVGIPSGQLPQSAIPGAPQPHTAGAQDSYEYGTLHSQAAGRYKVFATAFGGVPNVMITPLQRTGSLNAYLMGTAKAGSFRVRTDRAGTLPLTYFAIGQR